MRDIIGKLEELNADQRPVQEVLSSKGKENLIRAVQNFESMAEDLNLSDQAMDVIAMHLDDMLADVMEIEGVRESKQPVKEGHMSDMAQEVEKDHEVQMARNDLYKSAKYAVAIHKMMKDISEMEGIDGWVASKITKAADYLGSVKHYMEGQMMADVELAVVPVAGDMTDAMSVPEEGIEEVHEKKDVKEDFDSSHPDYQSHMQNETDKDDVMSIIKKHPEEAKKMMQAGDVFEIYGKDLYNELFDYMATESGKYMGGSDIDPVNEINDMLDGFGLLDLPNDAIGYGESDDVHEDPMNPNFMKQMSKMQGQKNTMSQQDMINSIIAKLPRDKEEMGIDGQAMAMKKPKINPVTKQKMMNKMAKDPYGADRTTNDPRGIFTDSKFADWSKK